MGRLDSNPIHARLSRSEKFRRSAAKIIKTVLVFSLPVILSALLVFVTGVIYIVQPYFLTKDFTRTTCRVSGYAVHSKGSFSCSDGTDPFHPCVKVKVMYGISNATSYHESTMMENEQALVSCSQCSYTFGKHGLLHQTQDACNTWQDIYDPMGCINDFIMKNGNQDISFPCFFNPTKPNEVVRNLVVDSNDVIHAISWPIIMCMVYFLGLIFVCYDSKQVKLLNECIQSEMANNQKLQEQEHKVAQERRKSRLGRSLGVHQFELHLTSQHNMAPPFIKHTESAGAVLGSCQQSHDEIDVAANGADMIHADLENLDLRHLDLAVSPRNIADLAAAALSPVEGHAYITYQNLAIASNSDSIVLDSCISNQPETSCQSTIPAKTSEMLGDDISEYNSRDGWRGNSGSTVSLQAVQVFSNNLEFTV